MATVTFQFEIDQELHTPDGPGCIEGHGLFWQPDKARRVLYYVQTGCGMKWYEESVLANLNRQVQAPSGLREGRAEEGRG